MALADWRRENVNIIVRDTYAAIKEMNEDIVFSISPQGNNSNNFNSQYCNITMWLRTPGYADIIIPQVYWGYEHNATNIHGSTVPGTGTGTGFPAISAPVGMRGARFNECLAYWNWLPRHPDVELVIGIPPYRIGVLLDGNSDEWAREPSQNQIGRMVTDILNAQNVYGFVLFDYVGLFRAKSTSTSTVDSAAMARLQAAQLAHFRSVVGDLQ
jgi:hypothetical protein